MKNALSPILAEAERVLREAVAHFKLSVPTDELVITIQSKGRKQAMGWFWADRWANDFKQDSGGSVMSAQLHEINLSAEWLPKHNMGETLLHELAHAENEHKDIKDCSGKVHNKHFKTMAESLGLIVQPREKGVGFGHTELGPEGEAFLKQIAFKQELFQMCRVPPLRGKAGSRLLKCECPECDYTVRVTQKWVDVGLPTCPCGAEMELV